MSHPQSLCMHTTHQSQPVICLAHLFLEHIIHGPDCQQGSIHPPCYLGGHLVGGHGLLVRGQDLQGQGGGGRGRGPGQAGAGQASLGLSGLGFRV